MWVESFPQKGSTFHFTLPIQAAPGSERPRLEGSQTRLTNLRVLIVDDNATNCLILASQTRKWGMAPRETQQPSQALEWLCAGEPFDLAILDMQMPTMDGVMLASEIRKLPKGKNMPLVLLTSMGLHLDVPGFANISFACCLTKPIKPAQLHEVLVRAVSGAKPATPKHPINAKLDPTLAQRLPLRVLLCDDNAINQKVATRLLQQMGYRADLAANGLEALAALDRQPYDIIFMDVMMPEMGGFEATRTIRERQKQTSAFPTYASCPIIVAMTANAMQGDREQCLAAGMDDYLAKPVRLEDVRAIVERWGPVAIRKAAAPAVATADSPTISVSKVQPTANPPENAAEAPVDLERLQEFSDGNPDSLRELVTLYLNQTTEQLEQLEAAVKAESAAEVRRVAHSCAGASATCGMRGLVPLLRELERQGMTGTLVNAAELSQKANLEFQRIRAFLELHSSQTPGLAVKA
jgi:CheY-like chemotaxis protein